MSRFFPIMTLLFLFLAVVAAQETTQAPAHPVPVLVAPWVLHSKLIKKVEPEYPAEPPWNSQIPGDVTIKIAVDEVGNVTNAIWIPDPSTNTNLALDALQAVRKWKYEPTLVDGKPVPVASWIVLRFQPQAKPNVEILTNSEVSTPPLDPEQLNRPSLRISSGVAEGNLIQKVEPQYPSEAKINHIVGDCILRVVIGRNGTITQLEPVSGHPLLMKASFNAVRHWIYKPYLLNGEPVAVESPITIKFHMGWENMGPFPRRPRKR